MGGGITLVFLVGVIGVFCALWIGAFFLFRNGKKKSSNPMVFLGGGALTVFSLIGLFFIGVIVIGTIRITNPKVIFERSFGFPSSPEVTNIQSSYWYFADTGLTFLRFKAPPEIIQRIVARGLHKCTRGDFENILQSGINKGAPKWWTPLDNEPKQFFCAERKPANWEHQDFASETEILSYNPITGIAFYCFSGVD